MFVPYLARWAGSDAWPGPTAPMPGQMSHPALCTRRDKDDTPGCPDKRENNRNAIEKN